MWEELTWPPCCWVVHSSRAWELTRALARDDRWFPKPTLPASLIEAVFVCVT